MNYASTTYFNSALTAVRERFMKINGNDVVIEMTYHALKRAKERDLSDLFILDAVRNAYDDIQDLNLAESREFWVIDRTMAQSMCCSFRYDDMEVIAVVTVLDNVNPRIKEGQGVIWV